jgi:hypothetical protein
MAVPVLFDVRYYDHAGLEMQHLRVQEITLGLAVCCVVQWMEFASHPLATPEATQKAMRGVCGCYVEVACV